MSGRQDRRRKCSEPDSPLCTEPTNPAWRALTAARCSSPPRNPYEGCRAVGINGPSYSDQALCHSSTAREEGSHYPPRALSGSSTMPPTSIKQVRHQDGSPTSHGNHGSWATTPADVPIQRTPSKVSPTSSRPATSRPGSSSGQPRSPRNPRNMTENRPAHPTFSRSRGKGAS